MEAKGPAARSAGVGWESWGAPGPRFRQCGVLSADTGRPRQLGCVLSTPALGRGPGGSWPPGLSRGLTTLSSPACWDDTRPSASVPQVPRKPPRDTFWP